METNKSILGGAAIIGAAILLGLMMQPSQKFIISNGDGQASGIYIVNAETGQLHQYCAVTKCYSPE